MLLLMRTLLIVTILLIFGGCASQNQPTPSQNDALNSVSKSSADTKEKGYLQEHLDSWLQNDWEKNTEGFEKSDEQKSTSKKNTQIQQRDAVKEEKKEVSLEKSAKEEDDSFTLQHYVDKIKYYNEHKKSSGPSHVEELEKMPVIGK